MFLLLVVYYGERIANAALSVKQILNVNNRTVVLAAANAFLDDEITLDRAIRDAARESVGVVRAVEFVSQDCFHVG
jgi:hypothetical protein